MKDNQDKKQEHKKFDALLAELDDGAVVAKIEDQLRLLLNDTLEVARSRGTTGNAAGTLTIKLAFNVDANGEVEIAADTTTKTPKMPQAVTRRWLDAKTLEIVSENPKQRELPFREPQATVSDLRSV